MTAPPIRQRARVLAVVGMATLPLLVLAGLSLWQGVADVRQSVVEERVTVASVAALATDQFVQNGLSTLESLALTRDIADPYAHPDLSGLLARLLQANPSLEFVGLYDGDGWNVALPDRPARSINIGDREYFQRAVATGRAAVSPALMSRVTGEPAISVAVPVDFAEGGRGVLAGALSLERLRGDLRSLLEESTVRVAVLDSEGQPFIHPLPEVARSLTPLRGRADVEAALAGQSDSRQIVDIEGVESLSAYARVPTTGWAVLVLEPTSAAFGVARRQVAAGLGLFAFAVALTGLIAWHLGGRLSLLYHRQLTARSEAQAVAVELQQASGESETRRRFLDRLIASAPLAIAVVEGPEHRYVTVNPSYQAIAPDTPLVGTTAAEPFPNARPRGGIELLDRVYQTGEQLTCTDQPYEIDDGTGRVEERYFTFVLTRYEGAEGEPAGVMIIALETTEAVLARQRLEREKDQFLSTASHELKTPLSSLGLSAQMIQRLLQRDVVDPARLNRYVNNMVVQVGRATRLISDLLDVSRIQLGALQLRHELVDLAELARAAVERQRDALEEEGKHTIVLLGEDEQVFVEGDEDRLDQVLTNLLSNAVKYSPEGGRVEVEVACHDGQATLRVADQGIGIPPAERERLFSPFNRTSVARQSGIEGTGLGLHITRQIVEAHGGTIGVAETMDGGATFLVSLPMSVAPPKEELMRKSA